MLRLNLGWLSILTLCCFVLSSAVSAQPITGSSQDAVTNSPSVAVSSPRADSNTTLDGLFDSLTSVRHFQEVVISPNGKQVAWVELVLDKKGVPSGKTAIYVSAVSPSAAAPRRITASAENGDYAEDGVSWSPDGKQLAFLSDANSSHRPQLYIVDVLSRENPRKMTNLTGSVAQPQWSPNGKLIAVLFTENAPRAADPLAPVPPEVGVIEETIHEQRITTVDVASGEVHQLSPPDIHIYEYDWAPDGKSFAVTAAHGVADDNWYLAQLYTVSLDSGEMKLIYKPPLQLAVPRWSPDGKSIAFVAGLMSDEGCVGGDVLVVSASGGEARDVTPGIKSSPGWLEWLSPEQIIFAENFDGSGRVSTVDLSGGTPETLWTAPEVIHATGLGSYSLSLSADHSSSAVIRQSFSNPPEIWVGPIGAWKQMTHLNSQSHANWGKVEDLRWTNESMAVQGWLMYPHEYDPSRHYPLIVVPHGGPGCATLPYYPSNADYTATTSVLSSLGYFVLYPNPRGSLGQGQHFIRANIKDLGYADFRDILAGVDQVEKTVPVDSRRLGITGWSWGGYWSMWSVTQTDRFKASVVGAGVANLLSYYGENDIDKWMLAYFGTTAYDDPPLYARSSPITFIKNVKTPTLIVVGERDGECPTPQSREFWHALKDLGVPTELVVYPGEGHAIRDLEHQRDIMERMVKWFDLYLH
jgi:dipeptidyl aminopeptidase/acylaminoacyl peptidase